MKKNLGDYCRECGGGCCRYVALELDRPRSKRDYDHLRWYLRHEKMHVFISPERKWFLEFETPCSALGAEGDCLEYETRPRICREHGEDGVTECEYVSEIPPYRERFSSSEELEQYLDRRGIEWRWKNKKG